MHSTPATGLPILYYFHRCKYSLPSEDLLLSACESRKFLWIFLSQGVILMCSFFEICPLFKNRCLDAGADLLGMEGDSKSVFKCIPVQKHWRKCHLKQIETIPC